MTQQKSLFDEPENVGGENAFSGERIQLPDADLYYIPQWWQKQRFLPESTLLFDQLKSDVLWEHSTIQLYGKSVKIPRLNAWYGDHQYQYSGHAFSSQAWSPLLFSIKQNIQSSVEPICHNFHTNSCLLNYYRNEKDSVAWHSDDEIELGKNPVIVSLSLGCEREFQLRHRTNKQLSMYRLLLGDGDLLIMAGTMQHYWHHQIPKVSQKVGERISLTFRQIVGVNGNNY